MTASKRITAAADAVGAALATAEFRERLSAAAPAEGREVKALALAELVRCGVDLTGVALALSWDPSRPALTIRIDRARPAAGNDTRAPRSR